MSFFKITHLNQISIYSELNEPENTLHILLKHRSLPGHIQGVYVQNILKLFTRITTGLLERNDVDKIVSLCNLLLKKLPSFISSGHIEVQERASSAYVLIQMLREQFPSNDSDGQDADSMLVMTEQPESPKEDDIKSIPIGAIEIVQEMAVLFAGDLNPVAPKAQKKVPLPDGLDLDAWINPPPSDSSDSSDEEQTDLFIANDDGEQQKRPVKSELTPEEMEQVRTDFYKCQMILFKVLKINANKIFRCERHGALSRVTIQII